jgi:hypothetical protein
MVRVGAMLRSWALLGRWSFEDVVHGFVGELVVRASGGTLQVVYSAGEGLRYATNESGTWQSETIDEDFTGGLALALDANGQPHVAYGRGELRDREVWLARRGASPLPSLRALVPRFLGVACPTCRKEILVAYELFHGGQQRTARQAPPLTGNAVGAVLPLVGMEERGEDLGRRAEVLTKLADQLSDKLQLERKANRELRALAPWPDGRMGTSRARRQVGLAAFAAAVAFVAGIAVFWPTAHGDADPATLELVSTPQEARVQIDGRDVGSATLEIVSTPQEARVQIDGRDVGSTPIRLHSLPADRPLRVVVRADGYEPWSQDVVVAAHGSRTIIVPLLRQSWTLEVASDPPGASVFVDGVALGSTPMKVEAPQYRLVEVRLEMDGYAPDSRMTALNSPSSRLDVRLVRLPPAAAGSGLQALTADQVREVVGRERRSVHACFERSVREGATDAVRIVVRARVDASGEVTGVEIRGREGAFATCVERAVRRWRFPPASGPSIPEIPFLFTALSNQEQAGHGLGGAP